MPFIDRQYITQVLADVEGDAMFPAPSEADWMLSSRKTGLKTDKDDYDFAVEVWERR
jgi:dihydrofolate reductase